MKFTATVKLDPRVLAKNTSKVIKEIRGYCIGALTESRGHIRDQVRFNLIEAPKTGQYYQNVKGKSLHRSSAPYEPPANLSGELLNSEQSPISTANYYSPVLTFGFTARYALELEYGNMHSAPRPYMEVSLLQSLNIILQEFDIKIRKAKGVL